MPGVGRNTLHTSFHSDIDACNETKHRAMRSHLWDREVIKGHVSFPPHLSSWHDKFTRLHYRIIALEIDAAMFGHVLNLSEYIAL